MSQKSSNLREYTSGMLREGKEDKTDYSLILDGPMFERIAVHLTKGGKVHGKRNWMLAQGEVELEDFRAGAFRHMVQWLAGATDEDHAAAIFFNVNGAEYIKERMSCAAVSNQQKGTGVGSQSPLPLSAREYLEEMRRQRLNDARRYDPES